MLLDVPTATCGVDTSDDVLVRALLVSAAMEAAVPIKTNAIPAHMSRIPPPGPLASLSEVTGDEAKAAVKRMARKR